jgi:Cof subfamily protein (haloacid dehalogenase superfamily)
MIRLVALDLDGTLLDGNFRVSEENGQAVRAVRERGVYVVLNTARWYGIAQRTARRLELTSPLICHNGAHVQEPDGGRELLHLTVPTEAAREIAAFCDRGGWETYTTVGGVTYMRTPWEAQIDPARLPDDLRVARAHAEHVTAPATGMIVFSGEGVRAVVDEFAGRYGDELSFDEAWSDNSTPYVTITAAGANKGAALRLVLEELGIAPDEAMAVGDATPDLAMFDVARVGVAMGNAPDEVKARADAVAPANTENGVAWALRHFVLEEG